MLGDAQHEADLRMLFLFLHEISGRQAPFCMELLRGFEATGQLSFNEWSLLKGRGLLDNP